MALSRGAAIAFYTVTSLAPVLLIIIAIAGLAFGQDAAQNAITAQLTGLMGKQTADVLQNAIASAGEKSSGIAIRHGSKGAPTIDQKEPSQVTSDVGTKTTSKGSFEGTNPAQNAEREMSTTRGHDPSLTELEREAARNRAELMDTVNALQNRISPRAIKQDVTDYVRDKKESVVRGLERRVRENPLQAAAIAAGAAYPLWRIVSSLPVPLLLIGAGVALTRRPNNSSTMGGDVSFIDQARQQVGETTDTLSQKLDEVAETVRERVHDAKDSTQRTAAQVANRISDLKSQVVGSAENVADGVSEKLSQAADAARRMSSDGISAVSETAISGYRSGTVAATRAGEHVMQAGQRSRETLVDTIQYHPMIFGAVALAVGAAIAAALPATRQEEEVFGAAGGELKRQARNLAEEGIDAAKTAAREVYEDTLSHAKEHGLSAESLKEAATEVANNVKKVISTAMDAEPTDSHPAKATANPAL